MLKEYGKIAPRFVHAQIKTYIMDLKRYPSIYENLVLMDGDILVKMSMCCPELLKECLAQGLGTYSTTIDLLNWALFNGPTYPSQIPPILPEYRPLILHHILDHRKDLLFLNYNVDLLNILLYLPTDKVLVKKYLDATPDFPITNEWFMTFLHRGNPANIPYIVSHKKYRQIIYQKPNFITKMIPTLTQQLIDDESFLGPTESSTNYYNKLSNIQKLIDTGQNITKKENWALIFWLSILVIRCRQFLQRYYEPLHGKGYKKLAAAWVEHTRV